MYLTNRHIERPRIHRLDGWLESRIDVLGLWVGRSEVGYQRQDMTVRKRVDERLETFPKELRDPPVAFAAASFLGPLFIVLLALAVGKGDVSSPLYSLAAIVFVAAVGGFLVTSLWRLKTRRAENERMEQERARRRRARRPSVAPISRSRPVSAEARTDARRAS